MMNRLLIVEDDEDISDFLERGLRQEGFFVEVAHDGLAAWQRLQAAAWDLVLLDWWLPGLDGLAILERLRKQDQPTPVILLTARRTVAVRAEGLNAGASDYLCKPLIFKELLARVDALLRQGGDTAET